MIDFCFRPIGVIKNNLSFRKDMISPGVKSTIEIFPEFIEALEKLEENSHIAVFCFFHEGKMDVKQVHRQKFKIVSLEKRGVFAARSPDRPNPISYTVVKLLGIKDNVIDVEKIDLINGTPVIDIKPYIREMDAVFNSNSRKENAFNAECLEYELVLNYLKDGVLSYTFASDDLYKIAAGAYLELLKNKKYIPDRNVIDFMETDFKGSGLDFIYYWSRLTPGEDRVKTCYDKSVNSFIKINLKTSEKLLLKCNYSSQDKIYTYSITD